MFISINENSHKVSSMTAQPQKENKQIKITASILFGNTLPTITLL